MSVQRWLDSLKPIQNVSYPSPQQGGWQTTIDGPVYAAYDVARLLLKIEADHVAALAEARAKWADIGRDAGYDEGYAKALGKARESYPELKAQILADTRAAVLPLVCNYNGCEARARAAIDALAAGQAPAAPGEVT